MNHNMVLAVLVGMTAAGLAFWKQAGADEERLVTPAAQVQQADAIFAGGCFWCVEADFDKVDGVLETISGYTGGTLDNPTYEQVSHTETGHYEAVRVIYDANVVSYEELVDYFWRHIDPTDPEGQFCDKGSSYRSAIFVDTAGERELVEASKKELDQAGFLPGPVVTEVLDESTFWPAEKYHQNYYEKKPLKYKFYRTACGRDGRVKEVWEDAPSVLGAM